MLQRLALAVWIQLIISEAEINREQHYPKQGQKRNHCQLGWALIIKEIDYEAKWVFVLCSARLMLLFWFWLRSCIHANRQIVLFRAALVDDNWSGVSIELLIKTLVTDPYTWASGEARCFSRDHRHFDRLLGESDRLIDRCSVVAIAFKACLVGWLQSQSFCFRWWWYGFHVRRCCSEVRGSPSLLRRCTVQRRWLMQAAPKLRVLWDETDSFVLIELCNIEIAI